MADVAVQFRYLTGLKRRIFRNARLVGNWDPQGRQSLAGSDTPMTEIIAEDGCPAFTATVHFDASEVGKPFEWSVRLDTPVVSDVRGVATEVKDANKTDRVRRFQLQPAGSSQIEEYYLTYARRLGARKVFSGGRSRDADLRFAVWAPNARNVEVVFGDPATGYIHDDGRGIDPARPPLAMARGLDGIWQSAAIPHFAAHEGQPYMYRVTNAQGHVVYRTDLFSRQQIGRGTKNPKAGGWDGTPATLDGTKSCSLVVSLDTVARDFIPPAGQAAVRIAEAEFWAHEFTPGLPVPTRIEDLVIYELHIGALGHDKPGPGTLEDAMALLPHLSDLGVNAVELLPMSEFSGVGWGYGDSHYFVIESSAGGRDQYKHFVRACHRRGIAVIQDVVYNHFDPDAERAEWLYDSETPEENIYYWYEGRHTDYAQPRRRISRQRLERVRAAVLGGDGPSAVRQQRGRLRGGVARRRPARGPDPGHAPRQRAARQRQRGRQRQPVRRQDPARVEPHPSPDQADGHAHRRGSLRVGQGHRAPRPRRPRLRRDVVCRLLPQPHRRLRHGRRPCPAAEAGRPRRRRAGWISTSSPARSTPVGTTRSSTTSRTTKPATPAAPRARCPAPSTARR